MHLSGQTAVALKPYAEGLTIRKDYSQLQMGSYKSYQLPLPL
jgi:hypothetical protein